MPAFDPDSLPPLRDVIARHGLMAKKSLGQHFLCDLNLTRRIAACAGDLKGCTVFEIGPGPGGLTRALLATGAEKVIAIEKDRRCIEALGSLVEAAQGRLQIIEADALKCDLPSQATGPLAIVANLPYNIGTELLIKWLHEIDAYRSLTLMFQSEVVDRLVAKPGGKVYGRLSVITQFCCDAARAFNIPARAFTPPPKVDSSVVHLTPRANRVPDLPLESLEAITAAAFGQRRKMLRSGLRALGGEEVLNKCGINPESRAETLSVADFVTLARAMIGPKS
ncbi:MAG: 16S rRNA (adenine(1518)-N(6)/adenine(1519)-N(6))-dimethyltransferase RsmA [Pseudomonadota bacterium]|nr:16S rRNA (adenine(1518)-N(6)/adenine(1519)-N(6))-dimethyltransferase RsmA [Pseudomonadota bacterium]